MSLGTHVRIKDFKILKKKKFKKKRTPKGVYGGDEGFFFTPRTGRQKVAFRLGCVT